MSKIKDAVEEGILLGAFAARTGVWRLPALFIAETGALTIRSREENLEIPMSKGVTGKYAAISKQHLTNIMY